MSELGTYHGASTIMRKTLDWNRSRICFEVPMSNKTNLSFLAHQNEYVLIFILQVTTGNRDKNAEGMILYVKSCHFASFRNFPPSLGRYLCR
jgi:hypothetical protein